jgi:redox-sensing transcriptional repressor
MSAPRPTIKRLSLYLRALEEWSADGVTTISSQQIGDAIGVAATQVRKDLGQFGTFGHAGIGYAIGELIEGIRDVLGVNQRWPAALVGVGNLGRALLSYPKFSATKFEIVAAFDADPAVVGSVISNRTVHAMSQLKRIITRRSIKLGIIAVPAPEAQGVANALVRCRVKGILNFAPIRLGVEDSVGIVSVDFSRSLEQLAYQASVEP